MASAEVELALSLYRDHKLVRQVLTFAKLPEGAKRVAISLDDPRRGPFIVVARDGGFVTCLGREMSPGDLPIVTRKQLDAIAENFNQLRERIQLAVSLTGGQVGKLYGRIFRAGPRLSREEVTGLSAMQPLLWTELVGSLVDIEREIVATRALLRNMRKPRPRHRELLRITWDLLWAFAHLVALIGKDGRIFFGALGDKAFAFLHRFLPTVVLQAMFMLWARGAWSAAKIGKILLGPSKRNFAEGTTYIDLFGGAMGLAAIGHGAARLRAESRKALGASPLPGGGPFIESANRLRADLRKIVESTFEPTEQAEEIALDIGRATAMVCLRDSPNHRFERAEDVPDDIARAFACWHWGNPRQELRFMEMLLLMVPWIVRQPLENLFLPSDLLQVVRLPNPEDWAHEVLLRPYRAGFVGMPEPIRVPKTPGRNDPCYCGSGTKLKRCCGAS